MQKWIILIIVGLIAILGVVIILNIDVETEYIPESEVEETEFRNTIITLYFVDKENGTLSKENKLIDSKELLKNPYKTIVEKLMLGPENEKNENVISVNTKILDIKFENGNLPNLLNAVEVGKCDFVYFAIAVICSRIVGR